MWCCIFMSHPLPLPSLPLSHPLLQPQHSTTLQLTNFVILFRLSWCANIYICKWWENFLFVLTPHIMQAVNVYGECTFSNFKIWASNLDKLMLRMFDTRIVCCSWLITDSWDTHVFLNRNIGPYGSSSPSSLPPFLRHLQLLYQHHHGLIIE